MAESPSHQITQSQTVRSGKGRPPVLSQPYPGTADLCPGGPVPSPQLVGFITENLINNNKKDNSTKTEPDTLKESEVVTNDDKKSKITAPNTLVHVTSTPAKASEHRSRLSPTHHNDKPKPPIGVGVANQLLQPAGVAKASLVVSTRAKEFKKIPPNQAGPLERKKNFRILKRLATNPIREDQTSKLDYLKIQEDIVWAKAVIPDFDIAMTIRNRRKRERKQELYSAC